MRLDFLHPELLAGAALVLLPLLIHLISRRKATTVRFAALEFVLRSTRRRARRVRLRQLLLLLARMALVALLAAAIAGPRLLSTDAPSAVFTPAQEIYCLDGSASMQARDPSSGEIVFDLAKEAAAQRIRRLAPAVPAALLLAHREVTPLIEPASFDRRALLTALEAAEVTDAVSDLGQCLAFTRPSASGERPDDARPRVSRLVVITDGAAHAWRTPLEAPGDVALELVRIPTGDAPPTDNRALTELRASPSATGVPQSYDVHFALQRSAPATASVGPIEVTLFVDERPLSRVTVQVPPGGLTRKRFMQVPMERAGDGEVSLRVAAAADGLTIDDEAILPLELPRPVKVVVVDGDHQTVRYRDEVFYLERTVIGDVAERARLVGRVVNAEAVTAADVMDADVLVLANVESTPPGVAQAVVTRVRGGAGLLITAGDHLDPDFYNGALEPLLPGSLRGAKTRAPLEDPGAREIWALEVSATDHPIFTALGPAESAGLSRVRTHTVLLIDPGQRSGRIDLMRFSNGAPALVERQVEAGRVLLLCTSVDRDWSDLAIRPGFLPLIQQSLLYLANSLQVTRQRRFAVGDTATLEVPRGARALVVTTPLGDERRIETAGEASVRFEDTAAIGLYGVAADLGGGSLRALPEGRFAVHVDPRESDTVLLDHAALQGRLPQGVFLAESTIGPSRTRPLWPWILASLAGLLLVEAVVSRRGG